MIFFNAMFQKHFWKFQTWDIYNNLCKTVRKKIVILYL